LKPYLLDINVLIALAWPSHVHHRPAQRWFRDRHQAGFRTCPFTQTGFVRISSNPDFTRDAVSPKQAVALLGNITALPDHAFWPDDLPLERAIHKDQYITGHRQIMDAYLLALAIAHGGRLATLDRGILLLSGDKGAVELVQNV
jgi:uncharacterized protein